MIGWSALSSSVNACCKAGCFPLREGESKNSWLSFKNSINYQLTNVILVNDQKLTPPSKQLPSGSSGWVDTEKRWNSANNLFQDPSHQNYHTNLKRKHFMSFMRSATYTSLRFILMSLKVLREQKISIVVEYFQRTDLYQLYIQLPLLCSPPPCFNSKNIS